MLVVIWGLRAHYVVGRLVGGGLGGQGATRSIGGMVGSCSERGRLTAALKTPTEGELGRKAMGCAGRGTKGLIRLRLGLGIGPKSSSVSGLNPCSAGTHAAQ